MCAHNPAYADTQRALLGRWPLPLWSSARWSHLWPTSTRNGSTSVADRCRCQDQLDWEWRWMGLMCMFGSCRLSTASHTHRVSGGKIYIYILSGQKNAGATYYLYRSIVLQHEAPRHDIHLTGHSHNHSNSSNLIPTSLVFYIVASVGQVISSTSVSSPSGLRVLGANLFGLWWHT